MVTIKEVKSKSDLNRFIKFGIDLYKGNKYFCPPLIFDEKNTFNRKKNPAYDFSDSVLYLAYKDNRLVGRIAGIINNIANETWNKKRLRFGWFDFVDDLEVSRTLLDAVRDWGKSKGMNEMNGPVGFTDFDHQGLLIVGFEYDSPMASLYNYPYYERHFDDYERGRLDRKPCFHPRRSTREDGTYSKDSNRKIQPENSKSSQCQRGGFEVRIFVFRCHQCRLQAALQLPAADREAKGVLLQDVFPAPQLRLCYNRRKRKRRNCRSRSRYA